MDLMSSHTPLPGLTASSINRSNLNPKIIYASLWMRLFLFAFFQALIAALLSLTKQGNFRDSAGYWLITGTFANLVVIYWLTIQLKKEGLRYFDVFRFYPGQIKKDFLILLAVLLISGPVAFLPNTEGAKLIFGDAQTATQLLIAPIPLWAAWIGLIFFPITIAFAEIPLYFGFIKPRIEALSKKAWLAIALPVFFLALQHCTLPLILDTRFILWRLIMFLPFALLLGLVLHWRTS
ncbi:MAG: hypothetical protein CVU46_14495 [Chloroflexi bacterium HGW-Chloroflexi-8]|jgi:hypothetical protein|nr:MAG: hypothetical protein CVU46_14495 [Chloroflexi bacterium HGW-Chloroflexi-8]